MNKPLPRALCVPLLLAVGCLVTNRVTKWLVLSDAKAQCGEAIEFDDCKAPLVEFVRTRELPDGEDLRGDVLPASLAGAGVTHVSRRGRFVIFKLAPTSLIPSLDAADSYFVYSVDREGGAVEELMATLGGRRTTYHIQYLSTPGWYYWMHG